MNGIANIVFTALAPCATASGAALRIEEALERLLTAGSS